jgi:hypothetical protein
MLSKLFNTGKCLMKIHGNNVLQEYREKCKKYIEKYIPKESENITKMIIQKSKVILLSTCE